MEYLAVAAAVVATFAVAALVIVLTIGKPEPQPMYAPKFVSWYLPPDGTERINYLCSEPNLTGFWYSFRIEDAYRFETEEEARAVTPVYDGSANIEARSGVYAVRG